MLIVKKLLCKALNYIAVEDISSRFTFDSNWQRVDCKAYKIGGMVYFSLEAFKSSVTGGTQYTIANVANGYRPKGSMFFTGHSTNSSYLPKAVLDVHAWTSGDITARASNGDGTYFFINGFYRIA